MEFPCIVVCYDIFDNVVYEDVVYSQDEFLEICNTANEFDCRVVTRRYVE